MERSDMNPSGLPDEGAVGIASHFETAAGRSRERVIPPVPTTLEEAGLSASFVEDLLLKVLYTRGSTSGTMLTRTVRLPFGLLDDPLMDMQQRHYIEVRGVEGHGRRGYLFDLTGEGRARAREVMQGNSYVGPAPVPGEVYTRWVREQSLRSEKISPETIHRGFRHLVLDPKFVDRIGPGINAGRSVFLYGPPGNGKTEIAYSISQILGTGIFIPHTVEVSGQIIALFDPYLHEVIDDGMESPDGSPDAPVVSNWPRFDPRFLEIRRPAVIVGGELTLDQLELQYDSSSGVFAAPPQMKANGGAFVIDDFGRQRVRPRDLLNRWMIPLDRGIDYLGLPTGQKLEVPFDCLVVFSTNLNPADLVEEAFLRRIRYKILVDNPDRDAFAEIFRRICVKNGIQFEPEAIDYIFENYYEKDGFSPRSCHPRDILADLMDLAGYEEIQPSLSRELLSRACESYFIDMPKPAQGGYDEPMHGDRRGR